MFNVSFQIHDADLGGLVKLLHQHKIKVQNMETVPVDDPLPALSKPRRGRPATKATAPAAPAKKRRKQKRFIMQTLTPGKGPAKVAALLQTFNRPVISATDLHTCIADAGYSPGSHSYFTATLKRCGVLERGDKQGQWRILNQTGLSTEIQQVSP